jgi:hypothetical protein
MAVRSTLPICVTDEATGPSILTPVVDGCPLTELVAEFE